MKIYQILKYLENLELYPELLLQIIGSPSENNRNLKI